MNKVGKMSTNLFTIHSGDTKFTHFHFRNYRTNHHHPDRSETLEYLELLTLNQLNLSANLYATTLFWFLLAPLHWSEFLFFWSVSCQ